MGAAHKAPLYDSRFLETREPGSHIFFFKIHKSEIYTNNNYCYCAFINSFSYEKLEGYVKWINKLGLKLSFFDVESNNLIVFAYISMNIYKIT